MELNWLGPNGRLFALNLLALGLKGGDSILQGPARRAANNCIDEPADRRCDGRKAFFDGPDLAGGLGVQFSRHAMVFGDIRGDEIGISEVFLNPLEHAILDNGSRHAERVVAQPGFFSTRAHQSNAVFSRAARDHSRTARAALYKTGKQVLRSRLVRCASAIANPRLRALPRFGVDDAQMLGLGDHPLIARVGAADAFAGLRVLDKGLPIPNDAAVIEIVLQDAVAPSTTAADRRGVPDATARPARVLFIEPRRDVAWRVPGEIEVEYPAHGSSLGFVDFKNARATKYRLITKATAAIVATVAHNAGLAAPGLLSKVLEIKRANETFNANVNFADSVIDECPDLDAREIQSLVDAG